MTRELVVRRRPVRVVERWFQPPPPDAPVDVVVCRQLQTPLATGRCEPFDTRLIDLTASSDDVLTGMTKNTRYEIRRAERDGITFEFLTSPSAAVIAAFIADYDQFALTKSRSSLDQDRFAAAVSSGVVELSRVVLDADGGTLVWHAHVVTPERARLLHSVSLFRDEDGERRNVIGRANRALHWQTMLRHAERGVAVYDLGGWYAGTDDAERLSINKFKQSFGGEVVREYDCRVPLTALGRVYDRLAAVRR